MKAIFFLSFLIFYLSIFPKRTYSNNDSSSLTKTDSIKVNRLYDTLKFCPLFSIKRQRYLDSILKITPWDAYGWQQKAMPLFKQGKYELGRPYLDSAVKYDSKTNHYLEYRAFMKCIFQKSYKESIEDFTKLLNINKGDRSIMDHSYEFYLSLCYLQLNTFDSAEIYLDKAIQNEIKGRSETYTHYMDWFYKGIIKYELNSKDSAIYFFDKCLKSYSQFSDALYYKTLCSKSNLTTKEIIQQLEQALLYHNKGYTINEDNAIYEKYPYQVSKYQIEFLLEYYKSQNK